MQYLIQYAVDPEAWVKKLRTHWWNNPGEVQIWIKGNFKSNVYNPIMKIPSKCHSLK